MWHLFKVLYLVYLPICLCMAQVCMSKSTCYILAASWIHTSILAFFFLLEEYLPFYSINSLSISFCFYLMTRLLNFAFSIFPLLYHFFILNFILTTPSLEHYKNFHSRCTVSFIWPPSLYDNIILKISIHCLICSNTFA